MVPRFGLTEMQLLQQAWLADTAAPRFILKPGGWSNYMYEKLSTADFSHQKETEAGWLPEVRTREIAPSIVGFVTVCDFQ